jgi:hypothetical protein
MTDNTFIVNDQPTDNDALDFTPYVQTLADIVATGEYAVDLAKLVVII